MRSEVVQFVNRIIYRSLVCATAPSSSALIIGRAVAGLGVSGTFTGCTLIVVQCGESFESVDDYAGVTEFLLPVVLLPLKAFSASNRY